MSRRDDAFSRIDASFDRMEAILVNLIEGVKREENMFRKKATSNEMIEASPRRVDPVLEGELMEYEEHRAPSLFSSSQDRRHDREYKDLMHNANMQLLHLKNQGELARARKNVNTQLALQHEDAREQTKKRGHIADANIAISEFSQECRTEAEILQIKGEQLLVNRIRKSKLFRQVDDRPDLSMIEKEEAKEEIEQLYTSQTQGTESHSLFPELDGE